MVSAGRPRRVERDRARCLLAAIPSSHRDWGYAAGGGAGYKFTDYFRADVTGDYLGTQTRSATLQDPLGPLGSAKATIERWDAW